MINKAQEKQWINEVSITKHFIERYSETILKIEEHIAFNKLKNKILKDMNNRLTEREKNCIKLLIKNKGTLKIPIDGTNQLDRKSVV